MSKSDVCTVTGSMVDVVGNLGARRRRGPTPPLVTRTQPRPIRTFEVKAFVAIKHVAPKKST